jgi:hypothetical protein
MTNSMIEKAARAAYENARGQDFTMQYDPKTHRVYMDGYFEMKDIARAILTAIKDPNEAMWDAGHAALEVHGDSARASCWAWVAMIDSILKEGT